MTNKKFAVFLSISLLTLFVLAVIGVSWGRYQISLTDLFYGLTNPSTLSDPAIEIVLWDVRIPRVIMAMLVGAGLSVAGASLQAVFGNPLVSEHILGVSSGAGFGAALGIIYFGVTVAIQATAVVFGLLAMLLAYGLSRKHGQVNTLMLILGGVIISSLFSSGISILQYFADPDQELPTIVFWLMGGLTSVIPETLLRAGIIIAVCIAVLIAVRWHLNIISLDEEQATSLGINVKLFRMLVILLATIITAVSVAVCGMISFVGIIVPHFSRMLVGNDNKYVIPATAICGAIFLLFVDSLARNISASEIPLSILTSVIGAPVFAYMLRKTGGVFSD